MMDYSSFVLLSRSLPDLRDGLKPVHRRILYSMKLNKTNKLTKSATVTGRIMEVHAHGDCLDGDTKIFLLDGSTSKIKDLAKGSEEKWVLSSDDSGEIVPALAHSFRAMKRVDSLVEIRLSNGHVIKATPEHKFKLINGEWIEAGDIGSGHILDFAKMLGNDEPNEHIRIYGNKTKQQMLHKIVSDKTARPIKKGEVVHHVNSNKKDNTPSNLQILTRGEHNKIHQEIDSISYKGFEASKYTLFDKNGEFYEKNRQKNSELAKSLSKRNGLVKANAHINRMRKMNVDITEDNYEKFRHLAYNLTYIDTLVKNGDIEDFDDLVKKNEDGMVFIKYDKKEKSKKKEKRVKTDDHKKNNSKSFVKSAHIHSLLKIAKSSNFNLSFMRSKSYFEGVYKEVPLVMDVSIVYENTMVYDFSVEKTHNAFISVSDDDSLFAVAHNCYPTIVNLVQKDRQNIPLLEGKGSWGQFTSNRQGAAASRYTEVKLGTPANEMMKELARNSVDYVPNYDGTIMLPEVLPVTYPTILTQANSGIGVGFASETLSYNIVDVRNLISSYLENGKMDETLVPDFPTGGFIIDNESNRNSLNDIMKTGRGTFSMRSKAVIDGNKIIVTEIPYGVKREQIMARIIKLNKEKKLPEVTDVRDGTSFTGMKIVITLRKNANPEEVLQKLYLNTPMQANVSANMNLLHNGTPQVLGVNRIIEEWTNWRKNVIVRGIENEINSLEKELHLLRGLEKILLDVDNAIAIIRKSKNDAEAINNLSKEFGIDDVQAKHVANIRIINLNEDKIKKQLIEIEHLEKKVDDLNKNVKKDKFINSQLIKTMDESIKQVGSSPRKTQLIKVSEKDKQVIRSVIKKSAKIDDYPCVVMLTKEGYLFKDKAALKQAMINLTGKLRLGDEKLCFLSIKNDESVRIFLEDGKVGRIKVSDINLDTGLFIPNVLDSQISNPFAIFKPEEGMNLLLGYSDGQLVRIPSMSYAGNNRIIAKGYRTDADLIFADISPEQDDRLIGLKHEKAKRGKLVKIQDVSIMKSRVSRGKNFLKPKENNKIEISLLD